MTSLSQGMSAMSVSGPKTPRGQGTTAYNANPQRPNPKNKGKGGPGKKLHFGYQTNVPGGRKRRRRSSKRRKSRRKSRKRRRRTKKRRRRSRKRRR